MKSVQLCSAAETDFTEALQYYAARNPDVALQFDAEVAHTSRSPDFWRGR
jgi:plasmid stabilization system protein ParE